MGNHPVSEGSAEELWYTWVRSEAGSHAESEGCEASGVWPIKIVTLVSKGSVPTPTCSA